MKQVDNIFEEMKKGSTGCFKDKQYTIHYLLNGKYHRVGGPSCIWSDGTLFYRQHNVYHREDGPAITGRGDYTQWWWHGEKANDKEQWLDPIFRRKSELKRYL